MPTPRESKRLLDCIGAGDNQALDTLFGRCRDRLRRLLASKSGFASRDAELDDLVQEAYVEALRRFDDYSYQGPDSFFRWLATVAMNRVRNLRREQRAARRDPARERRIDAGRTSMRSPTIVSTGPGPRTQVLAGETRARIEQALQRLSDADREVIVLARVEGLPLQQIAERMDRTRNAVALLLSRALRKLKHELDRSGDRP